MYPAVEAVTPLTDYKLLLTFDNGEERLFDMKPYLDTGIFSQLRDQSIFNTAAINFDTIEWANGADLCPEVLYEKSISHGARTPIVAEGAITYETGNKNDENN
ncbi:MAG: DUF2442 domain-containing protein [Kiritimatiellales bacterium]|nr:DUF2442 domain-containing protein [Kiritimatiellales bacterium]